MAYLSKQAALDKFCFHTWECP